MFHDHNPESMQKVPGVGPAARDSVPVTSPHFFETLLLDLSIDPGGPGGHPGGSRSDPGAEKHQKIGFFQKSIFLF